MDAFGIDRPAIALQPAEPDLPFGVIVIRFDEEAVIGRGCLIGRSHSEF